jgi:hypothetical protein
MKTKYTLAEKISIINNLEDARWTMRMEADIAARKIAEAKAAYDEALKLAKEQLDIEAWRAVETNWTAEEIEMAKI